MAAHVEDEVRAYLRSRLFSFGFARARCGTCGHDFLIAFSCKGRGICPSCNGRRMAQTAAHLVDHVIPPVPMRQWVISGPKRLRWHLAERPEAVSALTKMRVRAARASARSAKKYRSRLGTEIPHWRTDREMSPGSSPASWRLP